MRKILVVEDDRDLNSTISKYLTLKGFEVKSIYDGEEALNVAYEESFDIIILDIKLPALNGFEVAKRLREFKDTPIIFLTSLNSQKDLEKGFLVGGDDYITKPFSLNELLLRVNAIIKRVYGNKDIVKIDENIFFDIQKDRLYIDNSEQKLTQKELQLLKIFLQNRGKIVSKDEIFEMLYDFDEARNEASLRVFINRLRKLIGKDKIKTVKNIGYIYDS